MKQLGYRTHPQLKGPGSWRVLSENREKDGPGTKCKAKSKRKTKTNSHATTFHTPLGAIPGQSDGPRVPVTVILVGRRNSPVGVVCEAHLAHSGWGGPLHLVVFLIHLVGFWSRAAGAEGGVCIVGADTAGALRRGVRA